MAMCIHMRVVKMAVQSFHLVGQECPLVGHRPLFHALPYESRQDR